MHNGFNIRNISASKRVELLTEKLDVEELNIIEKSKRSKSESFWTICKARKLPIDTIDGFILSGQDNKFPWQELEYICIDEALRPTMNYSISSLETPRLNSLKSILEKHETRVRR